MREDTIYDAESRGSWDRNFPEDAKRFIADASLRLLSAPELPIRNASVIYDNRRFVVRFSFTNMNCGVCNCLGSDSASCQIIFKG
jgi:hypothetical protein